MQLYIKQNSMMDFLPGFNKRGGDYLMHQIVCLHALLWRKNLANSNL